MATKGRKMMDVSDQAYVNDVVLALEAAETMANRHGEDTCVLQDLRVVLLRFSNETPLEIVRPRNYKRSALD
jgi:hypothetical protein